MSKQQDLDKAIDYIEKAHGKGSVMRMGEAAADREIPVFATGSTSLDIALGCGGVPRGRITEIFGPESAGKTTLALHVIAEAQRTGFQAAFIDAEHALDAMWARKIGVKLDDLLLSQPDTGESALEIVEALVRSGAVDVIVIDSVAALVPKRELEGEMGDSHVGLQARLMSQAMRKLTAAISKSNCAVIFLNQIREKVGVMWGSPETQPGGRALKFYASMRLDIRRVEQIKGDDGVAGFRAKVKVVKNKLAPPYREVEFDILYDRGISREGSLVDAAITSGIIVKAGAWYSMGEQRWQGREQVIQAFISDNEMAGKVKEQVWAKV